MRRQCIVSRRIFHTRNKTIALEERPRRDIDRVQKSRVKDARTELSESYNINISIKMITFDLEQQLLVEIFIFSNGNLRKLRCTSVWKDISSSLGFE